MTMLEMLKERADKILALYEYRAPEQLLELVGSRQISLLARATHEVVSKLEERVMILEEQNEELSKRLLAISEKGENMGCSCGDCDNIRHSVDSGEGSGGSGVGF